MSLITPEQVRATVKTALSETQLQAIIDDEEALLVARYGAHGDGTTNITDTYEAPAHDGVNLFLRRPAASVYAITVAAKGGGTATTLSSTVYQVYAREGRIEHLGNGWGIGVVNVTYAPIDDRPLRRRVLTELVRLSIEQTAMQTESVAGEYSYTAPNWEARRASICRRLAFMEL